MGNERITEETFFWLLAPEQMSAGSEGLGERTEPMWGGGGKESRELDSLTV